MGVDCDTPATAENMATACALLRACLDEMAVRHRFGTPNPMWAPFLADALEFLDSVGELPAGFPEKIAGAMRRRIGP